MSVLLLEDGGQLLQETGGRVTLVAEVSEAEDSGFLRRRWARADLSETVQEPSRLQLGQIAARTASFAAVAGLPPAELLLGRVQAEASALLGVEAPNAPFLLLGSASASSGVLAAVQGLEAGLALGNAAAVAGLAAHVGSSAPLRAQLGRVSIVIGPDLVEEELDELMFLLEVA